MSDHHPSTADEADIELYTEGSCHAFAIALHRNLGMRLLVATDPAESYGEEDDAAASVVHVLAVDTDGNAWDALGRRPYDAVGDEILARHPDVRRVSVETFRSEAGLSAYVDGTGDDPDLDRPLHALSEDDVDEAWNCAIRILGDIPGFPQSHGIGTRP